MLVDATSPQDILKHVLKIKTANASGLLILCGENVGIDIEALITLLNENEITFSGGIFPKVIHGSKSYSDKILLLPTYFDSKPLLIQGLDTGEIDLANLELPQTSGSLFILVDGLSNYSATFTYCLYKEIGPNYQVFGAGAGYENFERKPCLFNQQGFFKDAAIIMLIKNPITQSIGHGWNPIAGPYIATKTNANILEQINWEPAYEVFKEIVEEKEGFKLTEHNFLDISPHYPFGVYREDEEHLIRDHAGVIDNKSIRLGAEIPSNSVLYLMKSDTETMLKASAEVCEDAFAKCNQAQFLFFAVCITRAWILKENFAAELQNVSSKADDTPVYGVCSLGEISSASGALLDYHHKTIVISILEQHE